MTEIQPARGQEAHVYVVEFSDGTVKVGYSAKPGNRIRQHKDNAACFGISIVQHWTSSAHLEAKANEGKLITWCAQRATEARKAEYFTGIKFDALVIYGSRLSMTRYAGDQFEAYEADIRRRGEALIPNSPNSVIPNSTMTDGRLIAGNPGDVGFTARLTELTEDSARLVLSNEETSRILHKWLLDLAEAYAAKDRPKRDPAVMSMWEWMTNPDTDAKYCNLIDPLHRAAEAAGFELEENPPWAVTGGPP